MDELRGPNIQIVLHVKEGLGFGFLRSPFIVSGSLNGYLLETDPVVPCHGPIFDAELVWEAEKRKFRNLRVQNVPVKVEVHSMGTQGRKDKVGYLLLSLLGAQPCPANKIIDIKHTWHRLLGVKSEGKCCHPQLLLSLSVEDRNSIHTPRNELRMFHSNEIAYPSSCAANPETARSMLSTVAEYIAASKKTAISPDLQPKLLCDEGLIKIGAGKNLFILSFVIGSAVNLNSLLPHTEAAKQNTECCITYSVFTHDIMTDRVSVSRESDGGSAQFNQRSSLRVRSSLAALSAYFAQCPLVVIRLGVGERDAGICSMDLRKLVPTDSLEQFINNFCNDDKMLSIHERCFMLACDDRHRREDGHRAYVDVEVGLKYVADKPEVLRSVLSARSITQLESAKEDIDKPTLDCKSGSCTQLLTELNVAYTSITPSNTNRYCNASGEPALTNEIAELIKKMCNTFEQSQERLKTPIITTLDAEVQCEPPEPCDKNEKENIDDEKFEGNKKIYSEPVKLDSSKSDTNIIYNEKDLIKTALSAVDRETIMKRFVEELEDWKERQQELYKIQLQRKEEYHLDLLAKEWAKRRVELECKLSKGIKQCRCLAADLSRATEDFKLRGYRNTEREKKLLEAKKALEEHYTAKYQELREASIKMEDDMNHQLRLRDMRVEELEADVRRLEREVEVLKKNIKNSEKEAESKYSGLTKDQTASLIQELRQLEEKLDSAVQSRAFFKEQWGRAVRELHLTKLGQRRSELATLRTQRRELQGLEPTEDGDHNPDVNFMKSKDDFYVDILVNTPGLESHSAISANTGLEGMEMCNELMNVPKNPQNEKLNELIRRRDALVQQDEPDEAALQRLNHEIRNMLLNCGS